VKLLPGHRRSRLQPADRAAHPLSELYRLRASWTENPDLDELLYVGLNPATTELVVIAPPELARRLA